MTRQRPATPARRDPPARREPAILNAAERRAVARDHEWMLSRGLDHERLQRDVGALRKVRAGEGAPKLDRGNAA